MVRNEVMDNIFNNHGHRISQWNDDVLSPHLLQEYADVIHAKGAPLKLFWLHRWDSETDRSSRSTSKNCLKGHKRVHSLKFQSVALPLLPY